MSDGLRALMRVAEETGHLSLPVEVVAGPLQVTGHIAPSAWFHKVTRQAFESHHVKWRNERLAKDAAARSRKVGGTGSYDEALAAVEASQAEGLAQLDRALSYDQGADELTLWSATAFPSVTQATGSPGGLELPVTRIPLAAITMWWVAPAREIQGQGGFAFGFGVLLPLDLDASS